MVDEWKLVDGDVVTVDFTVSSSVAVEQFTAMTLTDPRTATANTTSGSLFAGVAMTEKSITDGDTSTELGLAVRGGRWLVTASGAIGVGEAVQLAGSPGNMVTQAPAGTQGRRIVGTAWEAFADNTTGEIELSPGGGGS